MNITTRCWYEKNKKFRGWDEYQQFKISRKIYAYKNQQTLRYENVEQLHPASRVLCANVNINAPSRQNRMCVLAKINDETCAKCILFRGSGTRINTRGDVLARLHVSLELLHHFTPLAIVVICACTVNANDFRAVLISYKYGEWTKRFQWCKSLNSQ